MVSCKWLIVSMLCWKMPPENVQYWCNLFRTVNLHQYCTFSGGIFQHNILTISHLHQTITNGPCMILVWSSSGHPKRHHTNPLGARPMRVGSSSVTRRLGRYVNVTESKDMGNDGRKRLKPLVERCVPAVGLQNSHFEAQASPWGGRPSAPRPSRSIRMSRGSAPLLGPTMPRFSNSSMIRAARP